MKQLPSEVKKLIREFASDRLLPTPTALLIKQLHIQYQNETERHGIYLPDRLMVTTMSPTRFLDGSYSTIAHDDLIRRYHLVDFLPSYWSDYANTFDSTAYDDENIVRRLRWE